MWERGKFLTEISRKMVTSVGQGGAPCLVLEYLRHNLTSFRIPLFASALLEYFLAEIPPVSTPVSFPPKLNPSALPQLLITLQSGNIGWERIMNKTEGFETLV